MEVATSDVTMNADISATQAREEGSDAFIPLMGLGHFPMTKNFPAMKPALMQALDEIAGR